MIKVEIDQKTTGWIENFNDLLENCLNFTSPGKEVNLKKVRRKFMSILNLKRRKQQKNKEEAEFHLFIFSEKPDDIESVSDINMNFPSLYP